MSTQFDFSALNPLISRSLQAVDYQLAQMPKRDQMNDRAYQEWLINNRQKRNIASEEHESRMTGEKAARALEISDRQDARKRASQAAHAEDMEMRGALNASMNAARNMSMKYGGEFGRGAGVLRDFTTYGPWARGGRATSGGVQGGASGFSVDPYKAAASQAYHNIDPRGGTRNSSW